MKPQEPDSLVFKCGIEEVERSLRQGHLHTKELDEKEGFEGPFYEINKERPE